MRTAIALLLLAIAQNAWATHNGLSIQAGGFYASINSHINAKRPETGKAIEIDFEDSLNLDETRTTLFTEIEYRFKDRHSVAFNYFQLDRRAAQETLSKSFELENEDGETVILQAGTQIRTKLDVDVFQLRYAYGLYQSEDWNVNLSLGAHIMHIDMGLEGKITGSINCNDNQCALNNLDEQVTAPLPDLGIFTQYRVNNSYTLGFHVQYLAIKVNDIDGSLTDFMVNINRPFKDDWSVGLAYQLYRVRLDGENSNALWDIEFAYHGPVIYLRYAF